MVTTRYNPTQFSRRVQAEIVVEIERAMSYGYSKDEAAIVVAQVAMSCALGYTAAAMGKREPTSCEVGEITKKIVHLVAEMPGREGITDAK